MDSPKNLPINPNTHVCSEHFQRASNRLLRPDEVPSLHLPFIAANTDKRRKPPKDRPFVEAASCGQSSDCSECDPRVCDTATLTDECMTQIEDILVQSRESITELEKRLKGQEEKYEQQQFRLSNMEKDDAKIAFLTGFPNFGALQSFYKYLGPAVDRLCYSSKQSNSDKQSGSKRCCQRALPPIEEMFLTLVRLRLGLMEQDLAYRFNIIITIHSL